MAATARTVRHLRLRSGSEAAVRRIVPVLEDALRCASLGDEGGRLLVVRRLALGRLPADITSQALARRIEACAANTAVQWVDAGSPAADGADCVAFPGALPARVQLALRLVRAQDCGAWYWPRAVAEFDAAAPVAANLRSMAWTIAGWAEARVALPAWVAVLVRERAGAERLAACMPAEEGGALVERAGVAIVAKGKGDEPRRALAHEASGTQPHVPSHPAWLARLLESAGHQEEAGRGASPGRSHAHGGTLPSGAQREPEGDPSSVVTGRPWSPRERSEAPGVGTELTVDTRGHVLSRPDVPPSPRVRDEAAAPAHPEAATPWLLRAHEAPAEVFLEPTACGGLLFLLPVFQRLGLPEWLPPGDATFAARILAAALQRLRAPEEDPAWRLACREPADDPVAHAAPACWSDPLLARPAGLAERFARCASADAQAVVWLDAARRWLRRAGRIGLASLVLRRARVSLTATHADLHFDLAQADLRVRRLGLDLDPGWCPWFGRVVSFHYERGRP